MKYILVVFTSRNDTLRFYNIIKKHDTLCSIVSTPHKLSRSCGISVKAQYSLLNLTKQLIFKNQFPTFNGVYEINQSTPNNIPSRIY